MKAFRKWVLSWFIFIIDSKNKKKKKPLFWTPGNAFITKGYVKTLLAMALLNGKKFIFTFFSRFVLFPPLLFYRFFFFFCIPFVLRVKINGGYFLREIIRHRLPIRSNEVAGIWCFLFSFIFTFCVIALCSLSFWMSAVKHYSRREETLETKPKTDCSKNFCDFTENV